MDDQWVGVGDELVISGLFSKRGGEAKNLPILRSGIISAMPEEPFEEVINGQRQKFDAYLVEMRSIGGLSGSPVFLVIEPWRVPIAHIPNLKILQWHFYLLGLVRGRWDLKKQEEAQNPTEGESGNRALKKKGKWRDLIRASLKSHRSVKQWLLLTATNSGSKEKQPTIKG